MSKKKSLASFNTGSNMSRADYDLTRMKFPDLKKACIARGMPFEMASDGSIPRLSSWFVQHYDNGQDLSLLDRYDAWFKAEMIKTGKYKEGDPMFHTSLKMGFIATHENETNKKPRLGNKGLAKKKKKVRERIEGTKIFSGTKKAMTYQCQKDKMPIADTIKAVMAQFPTAKESSIKIWYKRSQKGN